MSQEYWVVGGRYRDTSFTRLSEGGGEAHGPFVCYEDALRTWAERSSASRSLAAVRYSIVVTASRTRAA